MIKPLSPALSPMGRGDFLSQTERELRSRELDFRTPPDGEREHVALDGLATEAAAAAGVVDGAPPRQQAPLGDAHSPTTLERFHASQEIRYRHETAHETGSR